MRNSIGSGLVAVVFFLSISFLTRLSLIIFAISLQQISIYEALSAIAPGFISDMFPAAYLFAGISTLALLTPAVVQRFFKWCKITYIFWIILVCIFLMTSVGEILFWDEFGSRFNFIAVDYLLYTHEVMHNIIESYPMPLIISGMLTASWGIVTFAMYRIKHKNRRLNGKGKIALIVLAGTLIYMDHKDIYSPSDGQSGGNRYANEMAQNGMYLLFFAFRNNALDYQQHYRMIPMDKAVSIVRSDLGLHGNAPSDGLDPIARRIKDTRRFRDYNVVVIMVESLSNQFMDQVHQGSELTPYMKSLYPKSLYFTQHYATGTRTVRGLEAFSLAVPPTPGSSIVRRPLNYDLYSLGHILNQRGYVSTFAYGGIGYFDNMNEFFQGNGYEILDQSSIPKSKVHFSNAWGVADEILFDEVLERADQHASNDKPFFMHVMTTSNHRPFTFPEHEGVPLAQGSRESAVQYTDFAIGRFIEAAKKKSWFKNTIFVITADHCASSAGKSVIDVSKYHIPWIIYAPYIIKPMKVTERSSQVDMAPTLLGLLRASYESHFFGRDKLRYQEDSLITLGTYQNLGFWMKNRLTVLSPQDKIECFNVLDGSTALGEACNANDIQHAIAWYELASERYKSGLMHRQDRSS